MEQGRGNSEITTAAAAAEFSLVLAFVVIRAFELALLTVALPLSYFRSPHPTVDLFAGLLFMTASVVVCTLVIRRRRLDDARVVWLDVATAVVVLTAASWFTPSDQQVSTWAGWAYPVTLSVAIGIGIGIKRWPPATFAVALLIAFYLASSLPAALAHGQTVTIALNSASYAMFALAGRMPAGYIRRLADQVDMSRAEVAELAQEAERAKHRELLHDQASVLALLAHAETDPRLAEIARRQAALGAQKVRRFIAGEQEDLLPLARQLEEVSSEFPDLDTILNLSCTTTRMSDEVQAAISEAVRTLLHNVRNHASAEQVVVFAQSDDDGWEVQVSDDGSGFDQSSTKEGFGLAQQVRSRMEAVGGAVEIRSAPGEGTSVRLTGPTIWHDPSRNAL